MCGYCTQSGYAFSIAESENFIDQFIVEDTKSISVWMPAYFQESKCLPVALNNTAQFKRVNEFVDIIFCRIWEMLLAHPSKAIYQILNEHFSTNVIQTFLEKLKLNQDGLSVSLSDARLYQDINCWTQFISNSDYLIECADETLTSYYNWWLVGGSDLNFQSILSKKARGAEQTSSKFYAVFPSVYFSFLYLAKYKPDAAIIKKIALKNPHLTPDFAGNDLWLKRKAFIFCVKKFGADFIFMNRSEIELDYIYYALIKTRQTKLLLTALKDHLISHQYFSITIDKTMLINTIESKLL